MKKSVYVLIADNNSDPYVFYVGCTNDLKERQAAHRRAAFNPDHAEYNTYKYQWIRHLAEQGQDFVFEVVEENCVTDDADEYSYILRCAEINRFSGISFFDGLPLTNMKAGDYLNEMLHSKIRTPQDIRKFMHNRERERTQRRVTSYLRNAAFVVQRPDKTTEEVLEELKEHSVSVRGMLAQAKDAVDLKASKQKRKALKESKK